MKKEVYLTKRTKIKKLKIIEMFIRNMPQYMKEKYQRLLHIVKSVLTLVPETSTRSKEDLKFADLIEDLFYIEDEYSSEDEIPFYMLPADDTNVELELNIDKLF